MMDFLAQHFDDPQLLIKSVLLASPVALVIGRALFASLGDLLGSFRYLLQPGWISLLRGETEADFGETMKLYVVLLLWATASTGLYRHLRPEG